MGGSAVEVDVQPLLDAALLLYAGPWVAERTAAMEGILKSNPDAVHPVVREIAERGNVKQFPSHVVLIHEGESADTLFIVLSGRIKVYAANDSGKEVILTTLGPGEYVGEMALDGGARSASVTSRR